jgi:DNA (cytosine-5)-methyltransferase 1
MLSVETFAGCGGLALGMAEAGFKHALVLERDPIAAATLLANKKRRIRHIVDWPIKEADIIDVDFGALPGQIDLVSGGPPCQPFSIGGKHRGPIDERNMWPQAIRAVRELQPKAFLFENVRGLLRPAFADYLDFIRLYLSWPEIEAKTGEPWEKHLALLRMREAAGRPPTYRVLMRGINAADYGAPQKRHRAIAIGIRADVAQDWAFPCPTHSREALVWSQWVTGKYWDDYGIALKQRPEMDDTERLIRDRLRQDNEKPSEKPWATVRDAIGDLPKPSEDAEHISNHRLHPGARSYPRHTGSVWDQPAKALKAGDHGVPGGENILVAGDGTVRYFTLREMARLQGLPDAFRVGAGWKNPIRQLGNAVPVQVGRAFGLEIVRIIGASADCPADEKAEFDLKMAVPA